MDIRDFCFLYMLIQKYLSTNHMSKQMKPPRLYFFFKTRAI